MALGARIKGKSFHTYVMIGDGELHEGSNWEAAMAGGPLPADQPDGDHRLATRSPERHVAEIMEIEPLADKWRAFGWEVREIDGHSIGEVVDAFDALPFSSTSRTA